MSDPSEIDQLMTESAEALARRDYLACERLCLQALGIARKQSDYERLGRIMMPLQEARRQRRQIAADAGVAIYSGDRKDVSQIVSDHTEGCIMLISPPYRPCDERALRVKAAAEGKYLEALLVDAEDLTGLFLRALEQRGDAAMAASAKLPDPAQRLNQLLDQLDEIGDHEIAHQTIADWAQQLAAS